MVVAREETAVFGTVEVAGGAGDELVGAALDC